VTPRNRRVPGADADAAEDARERSPASRRGAEAPEPTTRRGQVLLAAVRAVLGAALVLGLAVTVAWAARRHILTSPRFAIDEVVVQGAHHRTAEALEEEAGIVRGSNVFALDLDRARNRLLADPWVEAATLARHLPGKVFVQVSEREIGAIVFVPEPYLAARDGRIFKRLEVGDPVDLPVVTGLASDAMAQDREGSQRLVLRAIDLAAEYEHRPLSSRAPLQEVHVSNGGELTLVVGKDAVSLALGLPPFRKKLDEAARIFTELDHRGAHATVVMLDDEARPDRVVVRTR
jgi:cell division protein FtsQ